MFDRPTLATLVQRVRADVLSRLQTDDLLRRTDADVLARVMAGVSHGLYGFVQWLSDQIIYDTASAEYLERWASIWGVQRKPASSASGSVSLIVQAGAVVPVGTLVHNLEFYASWMQRLRVAIANETVVDFCRHNFPAHVFRHCAAAFGWSDS